jgi:hypothetical protein
MGRPFLSLAAGARGFIPLSGGLDFYFPHPALVGFVATR